MTTLDEYAAFATVREAMAEYARERGAVPWSTWQRDAAVMSRHFVDAPVPGRALEYARVRSETNAEAPGENWRNLRDIRGAIRPQA
eukprot:9628593-Alexandrium_andersonii.AAC.1